MDFGKSKKKLLVATLMASALFVSGVNTSDAARSGGVDVSPIDVKTYQDGSEQYGGAFFQQINSTVNEGTKFINNKSDYYGGAIYNTAKMTINGAEFSNNTSGYSGGAIDNYEGIININNSIFTRNSATVQGGAIETTGNANINGSTFTENTASVASSIRQETFDNYLQISNSEFSNNVQDGAGTVDFYSSADNKITNSTFTNNHTEGSAATDSASGGGAVFVGSVAKLTISGTTFTGNTSTIHGGAIDTRGIDKDNKDLKLSIINSTFTGNKAGVNPDGTASAQAATYGNGGAIYANAWHDADGNDGVKIDGSTFTSNSANKGGAIYNDAAEGKVGNIKITDSHFTGNTATAQGGAIYNAGAMTVNSATFTENTATTGNGGAIYNNSALETTIDNAVFTNNYTAKKDGGAIYNNNNSAKLTISNSEFTGNGKLGDAIKTGNGGAIYTGTGTEIEINNSVLSNNAASYGGAIYAKGTSSSKATLDIIDSEITNNTSKTGLSAGAVYLWNADANIDNTKITNNESKGSAGGVFVYNSKLELSNGSKLDGNKSQNSGGGIYVNDSKSTVTIKDSSVSNNIAYVGSTTGDNKQGGGGIFNKNSAITIDNSQIDNNIANNHVGGGIFDTDDNTASAKDINIVNNSSVSGNKAVQGAGIFHKGAGKVTINDSAVSENETLAYEGVSSVGGGIYLNNGSLSVDNTEFSVNSAKDGGGAIYLDKAAKASTIKDSVFTDNKSEDAAEGRGSAILSLAESLTITDSTFENNKGVSVVDNPSDAAGGMSISGGEFKNNESSGFTVGFFKTNSSVSDTKFTDNKVTGAGEVGYASASGAVFVGSVADVLIDNVTFDGNTANKMGAAITTRPGFGTNRNDGKLDITNSTFTENVSQGDGGAIWNAHHDSVTNESYVTVADSTFTSNSGVNGGAIYNDGQADIMGKTPSMMITDSTFTGNTATAQGGAIFNAGDLTIAASAKDVVFADNTANGVANDIYNTSVVTINAGAGKDVVLQGGINGEAGTLNITGAGDVTIANALNNQTVTVSSGTLNLGGEDAMTADGSHINVSNGANLVISGSEDDFVSITNGYSKTIGGAINNVGTTTIASVVFEDNSSKTLGGAINNSGTLSIQDVSFEGSSSKSGGAISNQSSGAILNVDNAQFTNNHASSYGGAVYNTSTSTQTKISNSTFTDNYVGSHGGAVYNQSGAAGKLTLENNIFSGNGKIVDDEGNVTVKATKGGAIYNNTSSKLDIIGGVITDNMAKNGGAIHGISNSVTNIDGTAITNNISTDGKGGAITVDKGSFDIKNATIDGNIGLNENAANYIVEKIEHSENWHTVPAGTVTAGSGGAIYNNASEKISSIADSVISNNISLDGGGIYNYSGTINIEGTKFENNTALMRGGAIRNAAILNIKDATFTDNIASGLVTDNIASGLGGAIYNEAGKTITLDGSNTFSGNKSNVTYDESGNILSSVANDIYNHGGTINIISGEGKVNTFEGGIVGENANVLNINGAGTVDMKGNLTNHTVKVNAGELHLTTTATDGSNLTGSAVTVNSGAVINTIDGVINDYSSAITLANGAKVKLDTSLSGTASADKYIIATGGSVTINEIKVLTDTENASETVNIAGTGNVTIAENVKAYTTNYAYDVSGNNLDNGKITLTKTSDTAGLKRAADDTHDSVRDSVTYTLTGNDKTTTAGDAVIQLADMTIQGAGDSDEKKVTLSHDLIVGADADDSSTLTINQAKFEADSTLAGKIVNSENATLTITDSIIGVAIENRGKLISDPNTYTAQHKHLGTSAEATYSGDTFNGASASTAYPNGGAIYNEGTLTIQKEVEGATTYNPTFTNNSGASGGAIYTTGTATISDAIISGNTATVDGGAMVVRAATAGNTTNITNTIFQNNTANSYDRADSGALSVQRGVVNITGSIFDGNKSKTAGALYAYNGVSDNYVKIAITDSVFSNNEAEGTHATTSGGGAIVNMAVHTYNSGDAGMSILGTSFTSNKNTAGASTGGGAIYLGSSSATTIGSSTNNNSSFTTNTSASAGGAIGMRNFSVGNNSAALLDISNATFTGNTAGTTGGAIDNYFYNSTANAGYVTVADSTFTSNSAANGGAIYNHIGQDGDVTVGGNKQIGSIYITGTTFGDSSDSTKGNTTTGNGGAIYNAGKLVIADSSFYGNKATGTSSLGGAIYSTGNVTINAVNSAVTFSGNTANGAANDIYMLGTTDSPVTLALNAASEKSITLGGGVRGSNYNMDSTGSVSIAGVTGANTIALNSGTLTLTADSTAQELSAADGTALNASSTNGLSVGTLTVADGKIFTNSGKLTVASTLTNGTDGATTYGTITNNGDLILGAVDSANMTNVGKIEGTGNLFIGDGTKVVTLSNAGDQAKINGNAVTINEKALLVTSADDITSKSNTMTNNGTLNITGASISGLDFNNSVNGTGKTVITNDIVNLLAGRKINQNINILADSSNNAKLVASADDIGTGVTVALNAGGENTDANLTLTGGTINFNIDGYKPSESAAKTYGDLDITGAVGNVALASDKNAHVSNLSISSGKTLINQGTINVHDDLSNTGSTITNSGTLNLLGGEAGDENTMKNAGTISDTGNVNIGSYTSDEQKDAAYVENTGSGSIAGNITIAQGSTLKSAADKVTDSNGITNNGTLNLTGGNLVSNVSGTTGSTDITGEVGFNNITTKISQNINIKTGGKLTANGGNIDGAVANAVNEGLILTGGTLAKDVTGTGSTVINTTGTVTNNASIAQKVSIVAGTLNSNGVNLGGNISISENGTLELTGGTVANDILGYSVGTDISFGKLDVKNSSIIANALLDELEVANGQTLTINSGNKAEVNKTLTNSGTIAGDGTLTLLGNANQMPKMVNEGNITIANTEIKSESASTYVENTGTITSNVLVSSLATLKTAADKAIDSDGITNNGTVILTAGDMASSIGGATTGTVDIQAGTGTVALGNNAITNNIIQLTSGTLSVSNLATITGASSIKGGAGLLDLTADNAINNVNLQKVDGAVHAGINVDLEQGTSGVADVISANAIANSGSIVLDKIVLINDAGKKSPFDIKVTSNTNSDLKATVGNATISGTNIGEFLLTIDNTQGDGSHLIGNHSDLKNAITSSILDKAYVVGNGDLTTAGDLTMGGDKLSVTANNKAITGSGNKITVGSGKEMTITGDTGTATIQGFETALDNSGTVNLTNVTMAGNTTDVANSGVLNLDGTNSINTVTGNGTTNVNGSATTVNTSLIQGTVNIGSLSPASDANMTSKGALDVTTMNVNTANSSFTNEGGSTATPAQIGTLNNKGSVENKGVLNLATAVDNDGILTNNGGTLKGAAIDNNKSVVNENGGTIENAINNTLAGATIDNCTGGTISGAISNIAGATVNNYSGASLTGNITNSGNLNNSGIIDNTTIVNNGTLASSGSITSVNDIDNNGLLANSGTITAGIDNDGTVENYGTIAGAIDNAAGKDVNNYSGASITGDITNAGDLANAGTISGTKHTNTGNIQNTGSITATSSDADAIANSGTLENAGTVTGNVDNDGTVKNYGTIAGAIDNAAGKDVNNYSGASITGDVTNAGNLVNAGTVTGNVDNDGTVENYGTIAGAIDNAADKNVNNYSGASITGDVTNVGNLVNAGTIGVDSTNTLTNNGGTVDNIGNGVIASAIENQAGTVNTTASGITGGVNNAGTLNLNAGDGSQGALASAITDSQTVATGVTNIAGAVTSDKNIDQATINVGNDGTGSVAGSLTNTGKITASDINVTADGTLNQNNGDIGAFANRGNIINAGTTNINGGRVFADTITNTAGTTTISGGFVNPGTKIANTGGTTNINSAVTTQLVEATGGKVNVNANGKTSTSDLLENAYISVASPAKVAVNTNSDKMTINNKVTGDGTLELKGNAGAARSSINVGTEFNVAPNSTVSSAINLEAGQLNTGDASNITGPISVAANATLNAQDGTYSTFDNTTFADGAELKADINAISGKSDNFTNSTENGNEYLTDLTIQDMNKIAQDSKTINLTDGIRLNNIKSTDDLVSNLETKYTSVLTPIRKMNARVEMTDDGLMLNFVGTGNSYNDFNPAVMASPVAAQIGGYLTQLNSYDEAFRNMDMYMMMTKKERQALKLRNKLASTEIAQYDDTKTLYEYNAGWFRPYATFEKVNLHNGPRVENTAYGSFFGGESEMKDLGHGWDGMWGAYVGYNGSHQNYDGVSIYQNGGTLGLVGMAYKDNFFIGGTINAGANVGEASTMYGNDSFTMLMAGIAAKTGYNWELAEGKFIIQPSLQMSYSFVNTFDYTNAAGVRMDSDPLHAIQIEPGVKFIGNLKHGWQPYAGISMVFNIMDRTHFMANDVSLPSLSVNPYVRYGVGVRKTWGERFTGFFQTFLMNGGRNGVGLQAGLRWAIGKGSAANHKTEGKTPKLKETKVNIKAAK